MHDLQRNSAEREAEGILIASPHATAKQAETAATETQLLPGGIT